MGRNNDYRDLEPAERRAAMMRAAGMSLPAIGEFLDCDYTTIAAMLKRPRVARYLLALESTMLSEINPESVKNLNRAIEHKAVRAFEVEVGVMERLYRREYDVRAQIGAATTAQDILDRAGKRAPTQTKVTMEYSVDTDAIARAVEALQEHEGRRAIDVTPGED